MCPTKNTTDDRVEAMVKQQLTRFADRRQALEPEYRAAIELLGESMPGKVSELVDLVLEFDVVTKGPHGAIWWLAKAHSIAKELERPKEIIAKYASLVQKEKDLTDAMKAAKAGEATEELIASLVNESGRPLQ